MSSLTPFADMAPVPRVLVDVPVVEFPAGSVTVSVQSTCEGRTIAVRGAQRLPATSPIIVLDPEPGLMVPTSYTVLGYDASGHVIGSRPIGSTTVLFDQAVIQQPLDPRLSAVVDWRDGTTDELVRESPGDPAFPSGQVLPVLVGLGPRRGLQGVVLDMVVESPTDAAQLQASLGTYDMPQLPVWLVRTPPNIDLPRVFFCHVPKLSKLDTYRHTGTGFTHFRTVVDEVRPPAPGISASVLTHSDMKVFFTTHTQVKAAYATHSDIKRDTSLVGAADT